MAATPLQLSQLLIERYNARDLAGMVELFADEVEFIRPGPVTVRGIDAARSRYMEDWHTFDESRVDVSRVVLSDVEVAAEIRMTLRQGAQTTTVAGAVFHLWRHGRLVRYRAYFDPMSS